MEKKACTPQIRFKGFTDPWEQRKLGEIGAVVTGNTPQTSNPDYYSSTGMPWITPTDIDESGELTPERHLSEQGREVARIVPPGSILCTCIASIGKNAISEVTCGFNQQINAVVPDSSRYDSRFLYAESTLWSKAMRKSAAAATMQIVNKTEFSDLATPVPSLPEQRQIGALFSKLDDLITLHQRKLELLKNVKKAMLDRMFV